MFRSAIVDVVVKKKEREEEESEGRRVTRRSLSLANTAHLPG